jgi:hypothetical protein
VDVAKGIEMFEKVKIAFLAQKRRNQKEVSVLRMGGLVKERGDTDEMEKTSKSWYRQERSYAIRKLVKQSRISLDWIDGSS